MWLFLLFLSIPLIEIGLFIQIGGMIGLWATLFIVVLTAILGTWLVRQQGMVAMHQLRGSLSRLDDPSEPLAHGAMILFSGALLLTPGFFTNAVGFALLIPAVRLSLMKAVRKRIKVQGFQMGPNPAEPPRTDQPIDAEYTEVDISKREKPGTSGWTKH